MADAKHTEGPWQVSESATRLIKRVGGRKVALVCDNGQVPSEQVTADAHLIAAAPELLAALRAHQELDEHIESDNGSDEWFEQALRLEKEADRLRAIALAKAGGESDAE